MVILTCANEEKKKRKKEKKMYTKLPCVRKERSLRFVKAWNLILCSVV